MTSITSNRPSAVLVAGNKATCAPRINLGQEVAKAAERAVELNGISVPYSTNKPAMKAGACYYEGSPAPMLDTPRIGSPIYKVANAAASKGVNPIIQRELWVHDEDGLTSTRPLDLNISGLDRARGKLAQLLSIAEPSSAQLDELVRAERDVMAQALKKLEKLDAKKTLTDGEKFERGQLRDEVVKYGPAYVKELLSRDELSSAESTELDELTTSLQKYSSEYFNTSAIDDLGARGPVEAPKGFKVEQQTLNRSMQLGGGTLEQNYDVISLTTPEGSKVTIGGEATKEMQQNEKAWKDALNGDRPADLDLNWEMSAQVFGFGSVGKTLSVKHAASQFMGGSTNQFGTVATYSATTGKPMKLDQLLSASQMEKLVDAADARLLSLDGDNLAGTMFAQGGREAIRQHFNENFALKMGDDGKVKVEVVWDGGGLSNTELAHFQFDAPSTPEFRKAVGLEAP